MSGPTRFQERTAAYVVKRFWEDAHPALRFLVADEVGLGKTVVAREVIRAALGRRQGSAIDIVYLCSSQPVASQNLKRLKVHGHGGAARATRLTLLATEARSPDGVRYFALTPDTSFKVTGRAGHVRERALIFWCLRRQFQGAGFRGMMQQVSNTNWESRLHDLSRRPPDQRICDAFVRAVSSDGSLAAKIRAMVTEALNPRGLAAERDFKRRRNEIIGQLRKELAFRSAEALASVGLVIVDEFQRFSHLLDLSKIENDFAVRLAERLLTDKLPGRRVLLLSATPYRLPGGSLAPGEKPYADFVGLVRFLAGQDKAHTIAAALDAFSRALRAHPPNEREVIEARDAAQAILIKIMSRMERTGSTKQADGMIAEHVRALPPDRGDLAGAIAARRIARRLKARDVVEYWKSAPFFLEFMRDYQFRTSAVAATGSDRRFVAREAKNGNLLLDLAALRKLYSVVPPSARLRDLIRDALPPGAERLLWVSPCLPYVHPDGLFAEAAVDLKRLIFTEWRLAPDAISAMVSYETEQRLAADLRRTRHTRRNNRELGQRHQRFGELGDMLRLGRPGRDTADPTLGMAPLALLLSGAKLAALGDPLSFALAEGAPVEREALQKAVRKRVVQALRSLAGGRSSGRIDERWYWAATLLLEDRRAVDGWLAVADPFLSEDEIGPSDLDRVRDAIRAILEEPEQLGRRPRDLTDVLTRVAIGSPGLCAYRALSRTLDGGITESALRRGAFHIARGFQTLFNQGEATAAVQLQYPGQKRVYWRQALEYCIDGNLQALLDEQLHFEADGLSLFEGSTTEKLEKAAKSVHASLTMRRASIEVRGLERRRHGKSGRDFDAVRLRCRHALRFAEVREADGAVSRLDAVRAAFNSPFRPFLLASTAVGQEGLDFHPWCHAVVHWNLPRSPVELEQREGRVHRYKGHAVRLNVARGVGLQGLAAAGARSDADPWSLMFALASERDKENDLVPCWVFENCPSPVRIKRIVPILGWSREHDAWPRLRDRLATYRLVMGMPRQDDLLETLERNGITPEQARAWRIDLSPRR